MTPTADPQETAQIEPGPRGRPRVERLLGVDKRGGLAPAHDIAETREEVARAAGRCPPDDLGDLATDRSHRRNANHVTSVEQDEDVGANGGKRYQIVGVNPRGRDRLECRRRRNLWNFAQ